MESIDFLEIVQKQAKFWAIGELKFLEDTFLNNLDELPYDQLDNLPFGVIELDDSGNVLFFNQTESKSTGIKKTDAKGKNFFVELAPCTDNFIFKGSFQLGIKNNDMNFLFPYTFTYKMKPTHVKVHFYRTKNKRNFIFIMRNESQVQS